MHYFINQDKRNMTEHNSTYERSINKVGLHIKSTREYLVDAVDSQLSEQNTDARKLLTSIEKTECLF